MKKIFGILLVFLLMPIVLAINVDVERVSNEELFFIVGSDTPLTFDVQVTNNGFSDDLSFYTFFGSGMEPKDAIEFKKGEVKNVTLSFYPRWDINMRGRVSSNYFIQGRDKSEVEEKIRLNIVELKDAFTIGSASINPESNTMNVFIENKVNFNFTDLDVKFSSPFFSFTEEMSLSPYEKKEFTVDIKKDDFNSLMAGFYTLKANVKFEEISSDIEGKIEFVEKDLLKSDSKNYGFIIVTKVITKSNEGNTLAESETVVKKNIVSRLFTTFNVEPDRVERTGSKVYYTWSQKIAPGETSEIVIKTNWLLPFLIIFFLIVSVYFARKYATQKLAIRKRVTFVKANGGEFALKVTIIAEAREFIEKIKIIDTLPPLVKMYERFGGELPDRISKDKRRLEWDFEYLDAGERRVMSYIVYSKVGVLGRFALPGTIGLFQKDGKMKQASSNKAFFLAEQKSKKSFD